MEENKKETNPYRLLVLGGYKIEKDFENPEAYDKEIFDRYMELIELAKQALPKNADEVAEKCKRLDEAFEKISTRDKRIGFKKQSVDYLQNHAKQTKQYKLGDRTFYIGHVGTLTFSEQKDLKEVLNRYLLTIVDPEKQSVVREDIFTVLDMESLEQDSNYREFVLSTLFSERSLKIAREHNYGYLGEPTRNEEGKYGIKYEVSALGAAQKYAKERELIAEENKMQEL